MNLPQWAYPPEPGFETHDEYSSLEVVWRHPDGRVIVQAPDDIAAGISNVDTVPPPRAVEEPRIVEVETAAPTPVYDVHEEHVAMHEAILRDFEIAPAPRAPEPRIYERATFAMAGALVGLFVGHFLR